MGKNILMTVGPIPARLDSVKFVTNRFKGGLAVKTANMLAELGHTVTLVAWKFAEIGSNLPVIRIDDVMDYYNKVLAFEADAYILAGAVANLMPSSPYEVKFPSHKFHVGEKFNIEFEIAPRVIDDIKLRHPRSTLIGYKLYDGDDDELIQAGKKTLFESRANIVFANHPSWAKSKKFAVTQDGAVFECGFDEHVLLIDRVISSEFYRTDIVEDSYTLNLTEVQVKQTYPTYRADGRSYGCFAVRSDIGFITTTRGKKNGRDAVTHIKSVDHLTRTITAFPEKATLNAPLLDMCFRLNPTFTILLHGHKQIGRRVHDRYEFAGSDGDLNFATPMLSGEEVLLTNHGYLVGFETLDEYLNYLKGQK